MSKYHARKAVGDGYTFDSQAEYRRYLWLRQAWVDGDIDALRVHPVYVLLDACTVRGETQRAVRYEADFEYTQAGALVVEDVKGVETAAFKIKAKLFRARYGNTHELRVVPARNC